MLVPTLSLGIILTFFLGYYLREVLDALKRMVEHLERLKDPEAAEKPTRSSFAEPMTRVEVAAMLEKERIDLLNP